VCLPDAVVRLGDDAFCDCVNLKEITLPNSIKEIGEGALQGCSFVKLTIPNSVEIIEDAAFAYNLELEELVIPDSISEIGEGVFEHCKNLKTINGEDARLWLYDHEQRI
jgi:hypothetical protein